MQQDKMQQHETLTLDPIYTINGEIHLPGSKSLSNRALLLAALATGTTQITNLLDCDDVRYMLNALSKLGVNYHLSADRTCCQVQGLGGAFLRQGGVALYLGNAGTAMRFLCATLCLSSLLQPLERETVLTGDLRMLERPIGHLVDALRQMGADIDYLQKEGYPPLGIKNTGLVGGNIQIDGSISSQFLTAVLMVAPLSLQDTTIEIVGELVSKPYIDITLDIMKKFGVQVSHQNYQHFFIARGQRYQSPGHYLVEGDASSASYFLAAAAIKGRVKVTGMSKHSIQGDRLFAEVLEKMGAKVEWGQDYIQVEQGELRGVELDLNHIPDAAMTLATTALFAQGETCIRNIYNWRVKETDRLSAMATELRKVGAEVEEGEDFLRIQPLALQDFKQAEIQTYQDHRMAMCFALIALSNQSVTILNPQCTAKTFPGFFQQFLALTQDKEKPPLLESKV